MEYNGIMPITFLDSASISERSTFIMTCKQNTMHLHYATAFSMQSCAESAYQPYADEYH